MSLVRQQHISLQSISRLIFASVKFCGVFILAMAFLAQMFSASFIVLNYEVNQSYIIENFCENLDKPELKCDGKCHLAKQIKEDADHKEEAPIVLNEMLSFILTVEELPAFEFDNFDTDDPKFNSLYLEGNYSSSLDALFRPPQV